NHVDTSPVASAMQRNAVMPIVFNGSIKNISTGHRIFIDYSAAPVRGHSNRVIGGLFALRDASHRLQIESEIKKSDGRFQTAFNNSSVGVALVSLNGEIIESNSAFKELFTLPDTGQTPISEAMNLSFNDRTKIQDGHLTLLSGQSANYQHELKPNLIDGGRWLTVNITLLHDRASHPSYYFYQIYDQTDRKHAEQKLFHLTNYDTLTGLMNLPQIRDEISHLIEVNEYEQNGIAVVTLDLDSFDGINDTYGVTVGDNILAEIATRLSDIGHYNLAVGRLSGDRFALIIHSLESVNQAMFITNRALEEIKEPYFIDGEEILMTACAGIAVAPDDGVTADDLLNASTSALQLAKINGKNQIHFYNQSVAENVKGRINNEIRIAGALSDGKLSCEFLAAKNLHSDVKESVVKVLVRWKEQDCYLTPKSFFNIANYSGLSHNLFLAVIDKVSDSLARLPAYERPVVIVPFYPPILQSVDLIQSLVARVARYGLEPNGFVFSLPGRLMKDGLSAVTKIKEIKDVGFRLCLNLSKGQSTSVDLLYNFSPEFCELSFDQEHQNEGPYIDATLGMTSALKIPVILNATTACSGSPPFMQQVSYLLPEKNLAVDQGEIVSIQPFES
ncbi:diguanylate cyclase, partial [Oceanospirillum sp. HFRX-1_2]